MPELIFLLPRSALHDARVPCQVLFSMCRLTIQIMRQTGESIPVARPRHPALRLESPICTCTRHLCQCLYYLRERIASTNEKKNRGAWAPLSPLFFFLSLSLPLSLSLSLSLPLSLSRSLSLPLSLSPSLSPPSLSLSVGPLSFSLSLSLSFCHPFSLSLSLSPSPSLSHPLSHTQTLYFSSLSFVSPPPLSRSSSPVIL